MSNDVPPFAIDTDICVGHGRCYKVAPESFFADWSGYGQVRDHFEGGAAMRDPQIVVDACPEGAISIITT